MKNNNDGRLTIISLPIGNLKDITIRALEELESSDLIFCEDTRTTIKLLNHYNIKNKLMSYHEHSDVKTRKFIIDEMDDKMAKTAYGQEIKSIPISILKFVFAGMYVIVGIFQLTVIY